MNKDQDDRQIDAGLFRSYDLSSAWAETKNEFAHGGFKDKAKSTAKLVGKSLWNTGLHIARNAPEQLKKAAQRAQEEQARLENTKAAFENMSNEALIQIVKSKKNDSERRCAYEILKRRKAEYESQKWIAPGFVGTSRPYTEGT